VELALLAGSTLEKLSTSGEEFFTATSLFNPLTVGLQVLTYTTIISLMCLIDPKQPPFNNDILLVVLYFLPRFSWLEVIGEKAC